MKYLKTMVVVAGLVCAATSSQAQITLNFNNLPGATIDFTGSGNFNFVPVAPLNSFQITGGGSGDSFGAKGSIGGTFNIGTITTIDGVTSAGVTGSGLVTITGVGGGVLTGTLSWVNIVQLGSGITLNDNLAANLSNVTFNGVDEPANTDLAALAGSGSAVDTLDFTVGNGVTLSTLRSGYTQNAFSGSLISSSVPEPTTVVAGTLLLLPLGLSAMRIIRNKKTV